MYFIEFIEEIKRRADRRGIKDVHIIDETSAKDIETGFLGKIKKAFGTDDKKHLAQLVFEDKDKRLKEQRV